MCQQARMSGSGTGAYSAVKESAVGTSRPSGRRIRVRRTDNPLAGRIRRSSDYGDAQSYRLADEIGAGAEVFSLVRKSNLQPGPYIDVLSSTGSEYQAPFDKR